MTRLNASEVRNDFAVTLNRVAYGKDRVVLHRRGKDLAAIIPMDDLALLEALEDYMDVEEARKALANPRNRKRIPWTKVKTRLGL